MSIVEKLHCDHCGRDETLALNHVWTIVAAPQGVSISRGLHKREEFDADELGDQQVFHLCSADCLSKAVARWAAQLPISGTGHGSRDTEHGGAV